jgi:hypothetical protein
MRELIIEQAMPTALSPNIKARVGMLDLQIPQVRDLSCQPGERSTEY